MSQLIVERECTNALQLKAECNVLMMGQIAAAND